MKRINMRERGFSIHLTSRDISHILSALSRYAGNQVLHAQVSKLRGNPDDAADYLQTAVETSSLIELLEGVTDPATLKRRLGYLNRTSGKETGKSGQEPTSEPLTRKLAAGPVARSIDARWRVSHELGSLPD